MLRRTTQTFEYDHNLANEYGRYSEFGHIYDFFIDAFLRVHGTPTGKLVDLCCGTGDIVNKFKEQFPNLTAIGYDQSHEMICASTCNGVDLVHGKIDTITDVFDNVISNNAYHHFDNIQDFWDVVRRISHAESKIFVSDIIRPNDEANIGDIVEAVLGKDSVFETAFTFALTSAYSEEELTAHIGSYNLVIIDTPIKHYKLFFIHN